MTVALSLLAAALAAGQPTQQAEIRNVRITSPKITVSRARSDSEAFACGQVRVEMSSAKKTVKKPVLRLVCLCEVGGALSVREILLDRPGTNQGMKRAEIAAAFKRAGVEIPPKERDAWLTDPAKFSPYLPEVSRPAAVAAVYGAADAHGGFFSLGRSASSIPRVLLARVEIWQNGVLAAGVESSRTGLGSYEIPADWHVRLKYPQKFAYADLH